MVLALAGLRVGLTVCEDVWQPGPAADVAAAGAELLINLSASPFHVGKAESREEMLATRARDNGLPLVFCNLVGGQDELVFDGHSAVIAAGGEVVARAPGFEEHLLVVDLGGQGELAPFEPELEQMRRALVLALRDYVGKNGFGDVVLGLSGGIDSALVAALAVDALGPERVHCVSMPSRFSSEGTQTDAKRLATNLGCDFRELPIEAMVGAFHDAGVGTTGLAAENLQARVRGMTLMSLSNEHGWLVLATGNKSELSVGYSTLYGDLAGGFALIKDVYKTDVFRLARYLNERAGRELIPVSIIERPPSAELRARPARPGLAAPVRRARPRPRGVRRARPVARGAARRGPRSRRRRTGAGPDRPSRVQAPAGTARREAAAEGVRTRSADADHERLERLTD